MHDEVALATVARHLPDAARTIGLSDVDTLATVTAALARAHDLSVVFDEGCARLDLLALLPTVPDLVAPAVVLATAREALMAPPTRRRHGAHYTPYPVA